MSISTLKVNIDDLALARVKDNGYNLCIARKVNNNYTVVWKGVQTILAKNTFELSTAYQVYGQLTFQDGVQVDASTNTMNIGNGQNITLDINGIFDKPTGSITPGEKFVVKNNYSDIFLGVNAKDPASDAFNAIYLAEYKTMHSFTDSFLPKEFVQLWFERNLETGTIIAESRSSAYEVDLTSGFVSVTYNNDDQWSIDPTFNISAGGKMYVGLHESTRFLSGTVVYIVVFGVAVGVAYMAGLISDVSASLSADGYVVLGATFNPAGIELEISLKIPITYKDFQTSGVKEIYARGDQVADNISAALKDAKSKGDLPPEETWEVAQLEGSKLLTDLPRSMTGLAVESATSNFLLNAEL